MGVMCMIHHSRSVWSCHASPHKDGMTHSLKQKGHPSGWQVTGTGMRGGFDEEELTSGLLATRCWIVSDELGVCPRSAITPAAAKYLLCESATLPVT